MSRRVKKKTTSTEPSGVDASNIPEYNRDVYGHLRTKSIPSDGITEATSSSTKVLAMVMGGIILASMVTAGVFQSDLFNGGNNNGGNTPTITNSVDNRPIDQLCVQHEDLGIHWHYQLIIYSYGNPIPIDTGIGIEETCMHAIHTHDSSGRFHLELPASWSGIPTLGHFFEIWSDWAGDDLKLSSTTLMGQTGTVTMKSDGFNVSGNPAVYILGPSLTNDDEVIELFLN